MAQQDGLDFGEYNRRFGYRVEAQITNPTEAIAEFYEEEIRCKRAFLTAKGLLIVPLKRLIALDTVVESSFDPFTELTNKPAKKAGASVNLPVAEYIIPDVLLEQLQSIRLRLSAEERGAASLGFAAVVAGWRGEAQRAMYVANGPPSFGLHTFAKFNQQSLSRVMFMTDKEDQSHLYIDRTAVQPTRDYAKAKVLGNIILSGLPADSNFERIPELPPHAEAWKTALYGLYTRLQCDKANCRLAHFAQQPLGTIPYRQVR